MFDCTILTLIMFQLLCTNRELIMHLCKLTQFTNQYVYHRPHTHAILDIVCSPSNNLHLSVIDLITSVDGSMKPDPLKFADYYC